jgi:hypothetical protein
MEIVRNAVAPQAPKLSRDWRAIKTFGKIYTGGRIVATSNGFVGTSAISISCGQSRDRSSICMHGVYMSDRKPC